MESLAKKLYFFINLNLNHKKLDFTIDHNQPDQLRGLLKMEYVCAVKAILVIKIHLFPEISLRLRRIEIFQVQRTKQITWRCPFLYQSALPQKLSDYPRSHQFQQYCACYRS